MRKEISEVACSWLIRNLNECKPRIFLFDVGNYQARMKAKRVAGCVLPTPRKEEFKKMSFRMRCGVYVEGCIAVKTQWSVVSSSESVNSSSLLVQTKANVSD